MEYKSYNGIAIISNKNRIPFHFENGIIELYSCGEIYAVDDGAISILGQKHNMLGGGYIYFHFPTPLENFGKVHTTDTEGQIRAQPMSLGSIKHNVDFFVENYEEESLYNQIRFSFQELDYFLPSSSACTPCGTIGNFTELIFSSTPTEIKRFSFVFEEREVSFVLRIYTDGKLGIKGYATTKSELLLEFEKTNDLDYLVRLFDLINNFFCFLCNRKNITLESMLLKGERIQKLPVHKNGKTVIGEKTVPTSQTLYVVNRYKDDLENEKVIQRTIRYNVIESELEKLFKLFVENRVSVMSIHSSRSARNLIDLKQSLQITASFEHYYRDYIPQAPSDEALEFYNEIKGLLEEYEKSHTGKKKKKVKSLIKGLSPEPSLMDKILKTYNGCLNWGSLDAILGEWFIGQVDDLAEVANEWRNELAHENGKYEPDIRVVYAIRLVEHLNYCIVLRQAGYCDEQIKLILEEVLTR